MTEPRIYVADLAAYNAGILHGIWIEATQTIEDIREQITKMLQTSPTGEEAEEYAIHDYEGFESIALGEYENLETVNELASFVSEHERNLPTLRQLRGSSNSFRGQLPRLLQLISRLRPTIH